MRSGVDNDNVPSFSDRGERERKELIPIACYPELISWLDALRTPRVNASPT